MNSELNRAVHKDKPITLKTYISYGLGDTGDNICFSAIGSLLTLFYTDYIGVSAATVALIMLISKFLDGISDFICGIVMERTHSRWGRCRPWVLWSAIPFSIGVVACFTVPQGSETMKAVYIFIAYNFLNTFAYTFSNLSQTTLNSLMTRDIAEREKLSTWRVGLAPIGHILASGCTLPLVYKLGNNQRAWIIVMGIWAVYALIVHLICFFNCEEQVYIEAKEKSDKIPLSKSIKALFANKYWWWALFFWVFWASTFGVTGTTMSYYTKYILGDPNLYSGMFITEKVVWGFGMLVLVPAIRKRGIGLVKLFVISFAIGITGHLLLLAAPTNITLNYIAVVLRGLCMAPSSALFLGAMLANVVEYGQWKTHIRQESMVSSASSVGMKVGGGLITALLTFLIEMSGYISSTTGGAVQPASAIDMIRNLYIWFPIGIFAILAIISCFYRLESKLPMIMAELKEREARGEL
ncbi:MAG: MFS transporter [Monoglobaceae bacterium]